MTQIAPWFERKFEFSFPVEIFPDLCIRLRGTPPHLEELLRGCSAERLTRKSEGKWSAQEHAGHLLDLEPLGMARLEDYAAGRPQLTATDLANRRTDEANFNACPLEKILSDFRAARLEFVDRVASFDPAWRARAAIHPRLKQPFRLVDFLFFVAEHDDHHLAVIWEMLHG
jgi:uncharacterized damage-inducible protein DinB